MGKITIKKTFEVELEGVLCVDADGNFLGEYFPRQQVWVEHRSVPEGSIQLPADTPPPPNHRCTWNGTGWDDPGPDPKEVERRQRQDAKEKQDAAVAKELAEKGYSEAAIKAILKSQNLD